MTDFDKIREIRKSFPILKRQVNGQPLVYLDSAATTQKPQCVIDCLDSFYTKSNANVHRGVHTLSCESTTVYEATRCKVAEFINAPVPKRGTPKNIIFTSGTTESVNLVAQSWGRANIKSGDEIIVSIAEHHSNIVPWQMLANEKGAVLKFVPVLDDGSLDYDAFEKLLSDKTVLVAITLMSNVLGVLNDGKKITKIAKNYQVPVLFDAAQAVVHSKIDVQDLDCDFLVFSAHKLYGPTGVGTLYAKTEVLEKMSPVKGGGEMINRVTVDGFSLAPLPFRFEAGTPNIAGVIGFGAALDFISEFDRTAILEHEKLLTDYALQKLSEIEQVTIYGGSNRAGVITFNLDGIHPHDLTHFLDQDGIAVRSGHHCAQPLMEFLQINSSCRISFAIYNTIEDIDKFIQSLQKSINFFTV